MASQNIVHLTDDNFDSEIINAAGVALVDFWAEWCMPCKMLAPAIEELATEYSGKVKIGKVDTEEAGQVCRRFGIQAIPTLIVFKDGQVVKKMVGLEAKSRIKAAIDEAAG